MARLQRKKQPGFKSKKPAGAEGPEPGSEKAITPGTGDTVVAPVKDLRKKAAAAPRRPAAGPKVPGRVGQWVDQAVQFLREVKIELKKVAWPSRKQTIGSTVVVIILVVVVSLFLGVVDVGLSSLVRVVLQG